MKDAWGSDHYPVIVEIDYEKKGYKKKSNRQSSWKTNWNKYKGLSRRKRKTIIGIIKK